MSLNAQPCSCRSIRNQKEHIILALKKMGHVVGFLGDGVNDAPAMHAADTSLSVDDAMDVAREAADFVLLEKDIDVIRRGVEERRLIEAHAGTIRIECPTDGGTTVTVHLPAVAP